MSHGSVNPENTVLSNYDRNNFLEIISIEKGPWGVATISGPTELHRKVWFAVKDVFKEEIDLNNPNHCERLQHALDCFRKNQFTSEDLMLRDAANRWENHIKEPFRLLAKGVSEAGKFYVDKVGTTLDYLGKWANQREKISRSQIEEAYPKEIPSEELKKLKKMNLSDEANSYLRDCEITNLKAQQDEIFKDIKALNPVDENKVQEFIEGMQQLQEDINEQVMKKSEWGQKVAFCVQELGHCISSHLVEREHKKTLRHSMNMQQNNQQCRENLQELKRKQECYPLLLPFISGVNPTGQNTFSPGITSLMRRAQEYNANLQELRDYLSVSLERRDQIRCYADVLKNAKLKSEKGLQKYLQKSSSLASVLNGIGMSLHAVSSFLILIPEPTLITKVGAVTASTLGQVASQAAGSSFSEASRHAERVRDAYTRANAYVEAAESRISRDITLLLRGRDQYHEFLVQGGLGLSPKEMREKLSEAIEDLSKDEKRNAAEEKNTREQIKEIDEIIAKLGRKKGTEPEIEAYKAQQMALKNELCSIPGNTFALEEKEEELNQINKTINHKEDFLGKVKDDLSKNPYNLLLQNTQQIVENEIDSLKSKRTAVQDNLDKLKKIENYPSNKAKLEQELERQKRLAPLKEVMRNQIQAQDKFWQSPDTFIQELREELVMQVHLFNLSRQPERVAVNSCLHSILSLTAEIQAVYGYKTHQLGQLMDQLYQLYDLGQFIKGVTIPAFEKAWNNTETEKGVFEQLGVLCTLTLGAYPVLQAATVLFAITRILYSMSGSNQPQRMQDPMVQALKELGENATVQIKYLQEEMGKGFAKTDKELKKQINHVISEIQKNYQGLSEEIHEFSNCIVNQANNIQRSDRNWNIQTEIDRDQQELHGFLASINQLPEPSERKAEFLGKFLERLRQNTRPEKNGLSKKGETDLPLKEASKDPEIYTGLTAKESGISLEAVPSLMQFNEMAKQFISILNKLANHPDLVQNYRKKLLEIYDEFKSQEEKLIKLFDALPTVFKNAFKTQKKTFIITAFTC